MKTLAKVPTTGWKLTVTATTIGECDSCGEPVVADVAFRMGDGWKSWRYVPVGIFCARHLDDLVADKA